MNAPSDGVTAGPAAAPSVPVLAAAGPGPTPTPTAAGPGATRQGGYEIEPFGPARWPVALQMLARGFPRSDPAWWQRGFQRTRDVPGNDSHHPIGALLHGPRGVAGVVMLYNSRRGDRDGAAGRLHVNLSSWAVEPQARAQVLWFGRQTLALADAVYTSLTPIAASARILQRFDFTPISHQRVLALTPRLALLPQAPARAGGVRVLDSAATLAALRHDPLQRALADHQRLGQVVMALETTAGISPLVWRVLPRGGLQPVAELIFAPSLALVAQHMVPLARAMLRRGHVLLEWDADEDTVFDFPCTALFRRRLGRGGYRRGGIDYLYSELVYLHR